MKKVVLFATAIALVIAIAATGVLAANKTTDAGKVDAGRVDGKVEETESGNLDKTLPNENAERVDGTLEPNEESDAINDKITPEAEEAPKQGESREKKFTIGTLHDFGVADWRNTLGGDTPVFPLSEYEELDKSIQFLNDYDIYLPEGYLMEYYQGDYYFLSELMLDYVELAREGIEESIADGSSWEDGIYNFLTNVVQVHFTWEQVFYAVADYYYGYGV